LRGSEVNKTVKKQHTSKSKLPLADSAGVNARDFKFLLACLVLTLICYLPAFTNDWTNYDDNGYVLTSDDGDEHTV
jgi:hypothetical protein